MLPPEVETERLRLRAFTPEDLNDLHLIFGDPQVMKYISGGTPRSREETEIGMGRTIEGWQRRGFGFWAVTSKDDDKLIGYCGLILLENTTEIEVAYGFKRSQWGKGFATEAARACLRFGFEELKLERIVAVVNHGNVASQRVLEKLSMTYRREVHHYGADLMYYDISSADYNPDVAPYALSRRG
ncbi:MAG TPA: GNAT family N-acetyltransferase [Pyrinomonadaceae bacterium]|nr:GNAT family N-acetyltransferase [Pyrinomonadaceae bacterium]